MGGPCTAPAGNCRVQSRGKGGGQGYNFTHTHLEHFYVCAGLVTGVVACCWPCGGPVSDEVELVVVVVLVVGLLLLPCPPANGDPASFGGSVSITSSLGSTC